MTTITKKREILLMISELEETKNPFAIALELALALKNNEIDFKHYEFLSNELFYECKRSGISTRNEICSLF